MKARPQVAGWMAAASLLLVFSAPLASAQNRRNAQSVPQSSHPSSRGAYSPPRSAPPRQNQYRPPTQGHHFGQWLNQHRDQSLDQQRRALQSDPQFQRLPAARQQEYEQRLQHFNSLPPERQQQVLRRGEVWEHLKPQQRQDFRNFASQYNSLPLDRRQAVRNAIQTLRAMPPEARQREIQSGRFSQFSPQERQMLNNASNLPLAPAQPSVNQSEPSQTGPGRYVPRPPH
jgi:Protein of unknown function (DUF3106)